MAAASSGQDAQAQAAACHRLQLASVLVTCLTPWAFEFVTSGMSVVIVTVPEKDSNREIACLV